MLSGLTFKFKEFYTLGGITLSCNTYLKERELGIRLLLAKKIML